MTKKFRLSQVRYAVMSVDYQNVSNITDIQVHKLHSLPGHLDYFLKWKAIYIDPKHSDPLAKQFCQLLEFEVKDILGSRKDKNRADRLLIEDCRKYIKNNPQTKAVILVSGDGDFVKLVKELKAKGIKVIVVSQQKNCSKKLKEAADLYLTLDQIEKNFIFSLAE